MQVIVGPPKVLLILVQWRITVHSDVTITFCSFDNFFVMILFMSTALQTSARDTHTICKLCWFLLTGQSHIVVEYSLLYNFVSLKKLF